MRYTNNGVPTWGKTNAPGTGQGESIREQNEKLFMTLSNEKPEPEFLPCVDIETLSDDNGDMEIKFDFSHYFDMS